MSEIKQIDRVFVSNSTPVESNSVILNWLVNCLTKAHRENKKNLSSNLKEVLLEVFGKNNKFLKLEFNHYIWILQYKDLIFNIFTGKRGTSIEIVNKNYEELQDKELYNKIIEFLEELYKLIN